MAQLDFFSYSEQYFLVSSTFWLFYIGCTTLFIVPFIEVMKIRRLISASIYLDDYEILSDGFFFLIDKFMCETNPSFFR